MPAGDRELQASPQKDGENEKYCKRKKERQWVTHGYHGIPFGIRRIPSFRYYPFHPGIVEISIMSDIKVNVKDSSSSVTDKRHNNAQIRAHPLFVVDFISIVNFIIGIRHTKGQMEKNRNTATRLPPVVTMQMTPSPRSRYKAAKK